MAASASTVPDGKYKSYMERYSDPAADIYEGNYAEVMEAFAVKGAAEGSAKLKKLNEKIIPTFGIQPHTYVMMVNATGNKDEYDMVLVHAPSVFKVPLGVTMRNDGTTLAYIGDVVEGFINTVFWPTKSFSTTDGVIAPTLQFLDSLFALDPETQFVGPFANGDAGTEPLFTRFLMYLPHKYVPLLLATEHMTARQAYERIGGAIRQLGDDEVEACRPLINYLRISCTRNTMQVPPTLMDTPTFPFPLDNVLAKHRANILHADLPGLSVIPSNDVPPGAREVVGAIMNLTEEQRLAREDAARRQAQAAEKTPSAYFGAGIVVLMRYAQVATPAELPRLYHAVD